MKTIQVVLDAKLLKEIDLTARRQKVNRSTVTRSALQQHLKGLREMEWESRSGAVTSLSLNVRRGSASGRMPQRGRNTEEGTSAFELRAAGQAAACGVVREGKRFSRQAAKLAKKSCITGSSRANL
jgi:hypothetical protein